MSAGPAAPAVSADVSSAPTDFEHDVADMFGDVVSGGSSETPEPESTSAAGTTPAEPAAGTETETDTPDAAAGDGAAPAVSDGTTPDAPPADATAEPDPFADTTPATYMVNGKPFTSEDIRVFKEGGAVIRPEALPNVLQKLSERDSLQERNHRQSIEYQTLAKATEWTDQDGKSYTGPEAAIELRIGNAALFAENQLLVDTLADPTKLAAILAVEDVPDGKGGMTQRIVVNPDAVKHLQTQNELAQVKLAAQIREHYKGVLAEASKGVAAPIDYASEAPRLIAKLATTAKLDASLLTADDRKLLADHLPDHTKDGMASLKWQRLVTAMLKDRAAQKASTKAVVDSTTKATKDAQARMAAAARGVKPAAKPAAPAPQAPSPREERMADEGQLFDAMLSSGAKAMRSER